MGSEPEAQADTLERRRGASRREWIVVLGTLAVGALLIYSRRPDAIQNPQFSIEDGTISFADAHTYGLWSLLRVVPYRGYFHTLPRLGGLLAQAVPLLWAPLVMNVLAIVFGALPAALLASRRFADLLPGLPWRLLAAFLCVASPGLWTTMANLTHSQWSFALLAALIVVARPPETRAGKTFDVAATVLSGLTGPTVVLLAPVAALAWWVRRTRWSFVLAAISAALAPIQILGVLFLKDASPTTGTGWLNATVPNFVAIFVRRVIYEVFLGDAGSLHYFGDGASALLRPASLAVAFAIGIGVFAVVLWRGPLELRLLTLFAALVLATGIGVTPDRAFADGGFWPALTSPGNCNRYFMILIFALMLSLVWAAASARLVAVRVAAAATIVLVLVGGVRLDWREPPLHDYDYAQYVRAYDLAAPGERVQIVEPPGWSFILTKR